MIETVEKKAPAKAEKNIEKESSSGKSAAGKVAGAGAKKASSGAEPAVKASSGAEPAVKSGKAGTRAKKTVSPEETGTTGKKARSTTKASAKEKNTLSSGKAKSPGRKRSVKSLETEVSLAGSGESALIPDVPPAGKSNVQNQEESDSENKKNGADEETESKEAKKGKTSPRGVRKFKSIFDSDTKPLVSSGSVIVDSMDLIGKNAVDSVSPGGENISGLQDVSGKTVLGKGKIKSENIKSGEPSLKNDKGHLKDRGGQEAAQKPDSRTFSPVKKGTSEKQFGLSETGEGQSAAQYAGQSGKTGPAGFYVPTERAFEREKILAEAYGGFNADSGKGGLYMDKNGQESKKKKRVLLIILLTILALLLVGGGGFYAAMKISGKIQNIDSPGETDSVQARKNTLSLVKMYLEKGEYDRALDLLDKYIVENGTDDEVSALMDEILALRDTQKDSSDFEKQLQDVLNKLGISIDALNSGNMASAKELAEAARREAELRKQLSETQAAQKELQDTQKELERLTKEQAAREEQEALEAEKKKEEEEQRKAQEALEAEKKRQEEEAIARANKALQEQMNRVNDEISQGK